MVRVRIFLNTETQKEPRLAMCGENLDDFLATCGTKLGLKSAKYAYTKDGQLLTPDVLLTLQEDDDIYISETEGFYRQVTHTGNYKISLLGAGGVGKSCITLKYLRGSFQETYDPSIEDAFRQQVTCDSIPCMLEVLDTAGQEEFQYITSQWVKKKHGFFLVYSMIEETSFTNLGKFYNIILDEYKRNEKDIPPIVVIGNKLDFEHKRVISKATGQALAIRWDAQFIETSAKTGENIEAAFHMLIRMMRQRDPSSSVVVKDSGSTRIIPRKNRICVIL